jgi:acetolactate synthase-1/2/3 large subunit
VPAAVAASILCPDRTVVNIAGDGDFLMTGQELATARAFGAGSSRGKLISLVVDNGTYGTIRMHQEREYPERTIGTDLANPDFAALARAYGWRAWTVERSGQFEAAFAAALAEPVPGLIHLKLDIEQLSPRATIGSLRAGRG